MSVCSRRSGSKTKAKLHGRKRGKAGNTENEDVKLVRNETAVRFKILHFRKNDCASLLVVRVMSKHP